MQTTRLPHGVFSTRICASNRSASADNSNLANPSGKLLHLMQNKSGRASTIPLDVYFFQRRRHDCRRAFSLLESVHRIAPPVQTILTLQTHPENCYISHKTKAVQFSPIPLVVYFLPTQTARLPQGVFSTRICASNRSANADT